MVTLLFDQEVYIKSFLKTWEMFILEEKRQEKSKTYFLPCFSMPVRIVPGKLGVVFPSTLPPHTKGQYVCIVTAILQILILELRCLPVKTISRVCGFSQEICVSVLVTFSLQVKQMSYNY